VLLAVKNTAIREQVAQSLKKVNVVNVLPDTLATDAVNYSGFLGKLDANEVSRILGSTCDCHSSPNIDTHHGHIITGDCKAVADDEIAQILALGAKYRPHRSNDSTGAALAALDAVRAFIHVHLLRKQVISDIEAAALYSSCRSTVAKLEDRSKEVLSDIGLVKKHTQWLRCKKELRRVHERFVVIPIDKAAGNLGFICKRYYIETLCKELGISITDSGTLSATGNATYTPCSEAPDDIIQRHDALNQRFCGTELSEDNMKIPKLWLTCKLHKNPVGFRFIAGARQASTKELAVLLCKVLTKLRQHWSAYTTRTGENSGINLNWSIVNSGQALALMNKATNRNGNASCVADFSSLYTLLPHTEVYRSINNVVDRLFGNAERQYGYKYLAVTANNAFYHGNPKRRGQNLTKEDVKYLVREVVGNSYVQFAGFVFHQKLGIPQGGNASPALADLCLSFMEYDFLSKPANRGSAKRLAYTCRYVDDICSLYSSALKELYPLIYPASLPLNFDNTSDGHLHFLDLEIDLNKSHVTLYDKRRDFNFKVIRMPNKSGNQPIATGLRAYYGQLVRLARIISTKDEFLKNLSDISNYMRDIGYTSDELRSTALKMARCYRILLIRIGICCKTDIPDHI
jgi:hypothetical protein